MAPGEAQLKEEWSALPALLENYSVELTARDRRSVADVAAHLQRGVEVFVANLPNESADVLVEAVTALREAGLVPVPHIVARNTRHAHELDETLGRLVKEAGVDRVLVLGGDRDDPVGEFTSALQLLETGLIQKHGIRKIFLACYPEGHPRISDTVLQEALKAKLAAAREASLEVTLVSQFVFDPKLVVELAKWLRANGIEAPLRVGVAGPADRGKLIKYAIRCGVGASLRILKERGELAKNVLAGETPDELLGEIAEAQAYDPSLGIDGAHFFTFGDPVKSARWVEGQR
ncbi:methylenetetrahydrofolate reductase [Aquamicrobium sp. LC103]|uniref:methylenetetrahydrofolate reductase n=1 Tax=Aquamicrobium sp. LC103 TaxID=1120658 RepID=UPI00063EA90B|nr:methylenetetrahydrofolate reductase [Aquamicrobium sp. LC103]TKT74714.1 methylenetetrahydrofolate reductase [Aquamicrobium sp. LC103]